MPKKEGKMKNVTYVGHQGDVAIFEVEGFPEGEQFQDELTKNGQLALGELSGHNHAFQTPNDVNLFKVKGFDGLSFFETKKDTVLEHGLIKGFKGREADQDYHNEITLRGGKKYITGIVEETDWLTRTVRKVVD